VPGTNTWASKYLVGADGGQSTVRKLAGIVREGDETTYRWIRIDAKMKTDMPDPDLGFAAIETEEYGNVLWVKLDKDAHRIGISLNPRLQAKYPGEMTEADVIEEATNALRPFKVEVERVDWWTIYR
jgi:phenol 2-monooxygenase (NADPH)